MKNVFVIFIGLAMFGVLLYVLILKPLLIPTQQPVQPTHANQQGIREAQPPTMQVTTRASSLKDLIASDLTEECTFNDQAATMQGTVYVSSGKVYGDFMAGVGSTPIQMYMIGEGDTLYTWEKGATAGLETSLNAQTRLASSTTTSFDSNKRMRFHCSSWNVDKSVFILPKNVTFVAQQ